MDNRKRWLLCLLVIVIAFFAGFYGGYRYFVPDLKTALHEAQVQLAALHQVLDAEQQKPPKILTQTETKTQIAYVPKETIIYRDAITGKPVEVAEETDVELGVKPPSIHMKYNGKSYEMPGISGEKAKFEKGKLVGEVSTAATLDVTELVNSEVKYRLAEEEKAVSIGGYLTNKGFVGSLGLVRGDREFKIIAKVPKFKEFYGAGMEFKF